MTLMQQLDLGLIKPQTRDYLHYYHPFPEEPQVTEIGRITGDTKMCLWAEMG